MLYFFIVLLFVAGIILFDNKGQDPSKDIFYLFLAFTVFLLWGLRYHLGGDSLSYEESFYTEMPTLGQLQGYKWKDSHYQPFWLLLVAFTKTIFGSFTFLQIIHSAIVNFGVFAIIKRYTSHIFSASLMYFVALSPLFCAEVMRESLAIIPFLFALRYYVEKKWFRYYSLVLVSLMFHMGAVFLLLLPLFRFFFMKQWRLYQIVIMVVIALGASVAIGDILDELFLFVDFGDTYERRLAYYVEKHEDASSMNAGILGTNIGIRYLLDIFSYTLCILLSRNMHVRDKEFLTITLNASLFLNLLTYVLGLFAGRWFHYFNVLFYIALAEILFSFELDKQILYKGCKMFLLSWCIFNTVWYYSSINPVHDIKLYEQYYPYHSVFNPVRSKIE